jgi:aerobic carbon-monoxide dehydrogenase medium subunit
MKPASFELHGVSTVEEAVSLLGEHGDDAKVLAGGQSLVPMLALRLARFGHLVDVNRVEDLDGVRGVDGSVRVAAATRHRALLRSPELIERVPLLTRATAHVGHFQIRNRGTLGGAIAHADPAAEQPAVALALDAVMEVASAQGTREVAAADFFHGTWTTALDADELLTAVRFPARPARSGFAVEEVARRHGDFAVVGTACAVTLGDRGGVDGCAIALFGVGPTPVRAPLAERALRDGAAPSDVSAAVAADIEPGSDLHATADYRRKVAGVLVARALERAIREAADG